MVTPYQKEQCVDLIQCDIPKSAMVRCVKLLIAYTGSGIGHTLESNPIAKGYIDYWEDAEGDSWAVKACIDGNYLTVMYIAGDIDNMNFNLQQMFLNGFRFPE